jgi:hypothetical protein
MVGRDSSPAAGVHAGLLSAFLREEPKKMQGHVTGELEAKLANSAVQQGCSPDKLVEDALTRYFEEEARFIHRCREARRGIFPAGRISHP